MAGELIPQSRYYLKYPSYQMTKQKGSKIISNHTNEPFEEGLQVLSLSTMAIKKTRFYTGLFY